MLTVETLSKNFGGIAAVSDISFEVKPGEIFALIGPNGAGKTTCFNLITGFYKRTSGSVHFERTDISDWRPHQIARLGIVRTFQKTNVLKNLSVFENVVTGGHRTGPATLRSAFLPGRAVREAERRIRQSAREILDFVGLSHRLDVSAYSLACGELRLLEIATALAAKPRILMLDEPAAGLNSQEAMRLAALLKQLPGARVEALLLVEHNMSLVMEVSDRVAVMDFGRMLAHGRPDEVRRDPKVITAYLGKEMA